MSSARRLLGDGIGYAGLSLLQKLIALITVPILTRVLGPSDYGVLVLVAQAANWLVVALGFGLDSVLVMRLAELRAAEIGRPIASSALWFRLAVFSAATAIGLAGLDTVAPLIGGPEAHGAVGFALVGTLGLVVVWHFGQVVQAQARHRLRLRFELAITLIYAGVNVGAVALLGVGVEGAFYGGLVTFLLVAPPYWYVTRDWHGWTVSAAALRRLLAAGLPLVPANVGAALVVGAGAFFLKAEAAYVAVGLLGVALMLANVLQVASYAFAQVWLPFAHGRTGEAGARQELARVHGAYAAALFVVWAAISLFAQEAIAVIVPPAYAEAHRYVAPLTAALAIGETGLAAAVGLGLAGRLRPRAWVALVAALFHLAGLTLAVPAFGLAGVAGMALATAILSAALLARVADRVYPVPYRWPPILLLWAVGALLVAPLQWLDLSIGHFLLKLAALAAAAGLPFGLRLVSFAVIRGLVRQ